MRSESCEYLGAKWLPIHTATDMPLMLGIAHTLVATDKHAKAFLQKYTGYSDKFEEYLLSKIDGQVKDAQWASEICGLPAEVIKQLAADFFKQTDYVDRRLGCSVNVMANKRIG